MIDLYLWPTPNGLKIAIALEEMQLGYRAVRVDIRAGDQFRPDFLALSPNNRIPAIVDNDAAGDAEPVRVFESGAILVYLADKTGRFLPRAGQARVEVLQWLFWQVGGLGPIAGQCSRFLHYRPDASGYAAERFQNELNRLYGVLDKRLADRDWVAGDYSIADMAILPWIRRHDRHGQQLADFPHLERWYRAMLARDAVRRGLAVGRDWADERPLTAEEERRLFTQTAKDVR